MAGKGSKARKVDGPKYRDNFDAIDWGIPKDWDYPEGSKTKEQRIKAMEYAAELGMWPRNPESK